MSQYTAPNLAVAAPNGSRYAYRRFGKPGANPVLFLQHFRGNLDNWDPALIDSIAAEREVILVDYSGVGLSTGTTPRTVKGLSLDVIAFVDALGLTSVDLFGFSLGGFVAQEIALMRPPLGKRLILAGTAPRGGRCVYPWSEEVRLHATRDSPGPEDLFFLFFSPSDTSQARAKQFLQRIATRQVDRDAVPELYVRDAQLDAICEWGCPDICQLARLQCITQPVLVANGNRDIMVPTVNSYLLAGHLPNAELIIYPDAGHGFLFQYPHEFAAEVNQFLTGTGGSLER